MGTKITPALLTKIRAQAEDYFLPDTGTVYTVTRTTDGQGGWTNAWTAGSAYDCCLDVVNGRELQAGGGYITYQKTILSLPHDAVVSNKDRFYYGTCTYNVVAVSDATRSNNFFVRAELERV
jgi:head-tail adaptor